jgi:hypothetical protein
MQQDFASAMVQPRVVRCIGLPLKPFSLGHLLLLRHLDSAFVTGGQKTYNDFLTAVFVCAHSWEENQKILRSRFRQWLQVKVWSAFAGNFNIPVQADILSNYIAAARETPEQRAGKPGATRYLVSEWEARIYKFLRWVGCSNIEALDMPLAVAQAMFIAELEEGERASFRVERDDPISRALSGVLEKAEREGFAA